MPTSATAGTGTCQNRQPAGKAEVTTRPEPPAPGGKPSRKVKVRDDVDPDYAEEAEDFFYGEGM